VELHGGSVEAFSDGPGRGAAFLVQLPTAARETRDVGRARGLDSSGEVAPSGTGDSRDCSSVSA
jgi:hypothetical protein